MDDAFDVNGNNLSQELRRLWAHFDAVVAALNRAGDERRKVENVALEKERDDAAWVELDVAATVENAFRARRDVLQAEIVHLEAQISEARNEDL